MAKSHRSTATKTVPALNRLTGKKVVFHGKFPYGHLELLRSKAEAQQGTIQKDLDSKTDYLVLADLAGSKTLQKKAHALNSKGASIQVVDEAAFDSLVAATDDELLELIRAGDAKRYMACMGIFTVGVPYHWGQFLSSPAARTVYDSETFRGVDLSGFPFYEVEFRNCDFSGVKIHDLALMFAANCDFSNVSGANCQFKNVPGCRFTNAKLESARFCGDLTGAYFDGATLSNAIFSDWSFHSNRMVQKSVSFVRANLRSAQFGSTKLISPDFNSADLTNAGFSNCQLESAKLQDAVLRKATLANCKLIGADLRNADLSGANLAMADLSGANLVGANLQGANLRGTILKGVDLSMAKNYEPAGTPRGGIGPALTELDTIISQAKKIQISFELKGSEDKPTEHVTFDSSALRWGSGLRLSKGIAGGFFHLAQARTCSKQMLDLADFAGQYQVCFETLEVKSAKSPKSGKELRGLVIQGIAEAFAQGVPSEDELKAAAKQRRAVKHDERAAEREERKKAKFAAEKIKEKEKQRIAKKVKKEVGNVTDVASFLKALEVRIEKPKIRKATQMLKASGFKLFNDVTTESVSGVVKSQTDPDLIYACHVDQDGKYCCCTQNLNICGGLRGSLCKHQLVLIIGLVQAGELDPTTIDEWISKTHSNKPELDKEAMGAVFIKYKGAEAGEIDWRPTETVPEDYYAL